MKNGNRNIIRRIFLELDYTRIIIMDVVIIVYCFFLCFDCYRKGVPSIGNLALFDAVAVTVTLPVFLVSDGCSRPAKGYRDADRYCFKRRGSGKACKGKHL